jgi:hypothetical protein
MKELPLDNAASKLLATYGVKAIWDMYLAAAAASGMGEHELAVSLINLVEAAERRLMSDPSRPLAIDRPI